MEKYKTINPIPTFERDAVEIFHDMHRDSLAVTICIDQAVEGVLSDLVVTFESYVSALSLDAHWHPKAPEYLDSFPTIESFSWPLVEVDESLWLGVVSSSQIDVAGIPKNYRFISLNNTFDVLTFSEPKFNWVKSEQLISRQFKSNEDYYFFLAIGAEDSEHRCNEIGCENYRVSSSKKCRKHHFEMIRGYQPPVGVS